MPPAVFKTVCAAWDATGWVGSIPMRFRHFNGVLAIAAKDVEFVDIFSVGELNFTPHGSRSARRETVGRGRRFGSLLARDRGHFRPS